MIALFALSLLTPVAGQSMEMRRLADIDLAEQVGAYRPARKPSRDRVTDDPYLPTDERPRFRLRGAKVKMWMPI